MNEKLLKLLGKITSNIYLNGLLLGTIGGYVLFLLMHPKDDQKWIDLVNSWQTLISAILALIAAWWTVKTIEKQISDERERHNEIRTRKALSMRAQMPDALDQIIDYTRRCFIYLHDQNANIPESCPEAIQVFKNSIEFIDSETATSVYEMVSFYQVYNARLNGYNTRERPISEHTERMLDTFRLSYYALRIFDYARNEAQNVPNHRPTRSDMLAALKAVVGNERYHMNSGKYEGIVRMVERRYPRSD